MIQVGLQFPNAELPATFILMHCITLLVDLFPFNFAIAQQA
jgi:hypothetical protein